MVVKHERRGGREVRWRLAAALVGLAAVGAGCSEDEAAAADAGTGGLPTVTAEVVAQYAAVVHASYADSLAAAEAMDAAIAAFLAAPTPESLAEARAAWLAAREPYLQTEVYRFYDGPIDHPEDGPEGQINAWPLDEQYIDYVEGAETAGIVNDDSVALSAETLLALNEQGGEANVATGFHAIEFLLWGQDLSADGPGARPHTDYLTDGSGTAANQARRAEYLQVVSTLLVDQLAGLTAAWAPGASGNYAAEFVAAEPAVGLERILTGMIVLTGFETGGERLQTAFDSADQEDEHSCFSDNTHRDMVQDVRGVQNVWRGTYLKLDGTAVSGPGVKDVVAARDAELAGRIDAQVDESLALAEALVPPFDREIALDNPAGRARVEALIVSLRATEGLFQDAFRAFDLSVPEVE